MQAAVLKPAPPNTLLHEQWITRRKGSYRSDIPGAAAILCFIAFGTGIIDADIREHLWAFVWMSLALGIVLSALALWARAGLRFHLRVYETPSGLMVNLSAPAPRPDIELHSQVRFDYGMFEENIDAAVASRVAPVLWVQFRDAQKRTITVRRALGIQHEVPAWPEHPCFEADSNVFSGDPQALMRVLRFINDKNNQG